ncbi:MAG: non-homologous end-joining DNA ligase [Actinomycetota bacterium]
MKAGKRTVEITRPDKELFPGITKRDLCEYYARVAPAMLPLVAGRPITMERYPDGISGQRLMQKNAPKYFPDWIRRAVVRKSGGTVEHPIADDAAVLVYMANQAAITLHMWLSDIEHADNPDQMVFDLDPTGCSWRQIVEGARAVREMLASLGVPVFLKTSGSRGLHLHVPLDRSATYADVRAFSESIASRLQALDPSLFTTEFHKAKREACLFLDVARNAYAQTIVAPFSVRALPGAPVSVPIEWDELDQIEGATAFTIATVSARLDAGVDPWRGFKRARRSLRAAAKKLDQTV